MGSPGHRDRKVSVVLVELASKAYLATQDVMDCQVCCHVSCFFPFIVEYFLTVEADNSKHPAVKHGLLRQTKIKLQLFQDWLTSPRPLFAIH